MKKTLLFVAMLFSIAKFLFAQVAPFCLSIGTSTINYPICGTATHDGNYAVAGIVDIGANQNLFIAKVDIAGNILWYHDEGSPFVDDWYSIIETSDHFLVAVGLLGGKMGMVKYDQSGNEIWKKQITVQTDDAAADIIETSDGNYLLTGTAENFGDLYLAIIKVSPDGNLLWNKNFYGTYHAEIGYSCTETADHRYVIGGYSSIFSNQFFLVSLQEDGTLQWVKKSVDGGVAYDLIATNDSSVIAAGYGCKILECNRVLAKLDASGNPTWSYAYGDTSYGRFYSITELSDGSFVAAGDVTDQSSFAKACVVKVDANGQMLWGKTTDDNEFRALSGTSDGGMLIGGRRGTGFKVMKIDADGNGCPGCPTTDYGPQSTGTAFTDWSLNEFNAVATIEDATITETNNSLTSTVYCSVGIENVSGSESGFFISPNPADQLAVGSWQLAIKEAPTLKIFDIAGRAIFESSIVNGQSSINVDVSHWQNGIYFCNFYSGNEPMVSKLMVQH